MALFVLFFLFCSLFLPVSSAEIAVSGVSSLAMDTNYTSPFTDNMEILAHFFGTEEQKAPNVSISTTSKDEAYFVHPWFGDPDITSYRTVFSSFFSLRTSRSLSWRNQGRSAMLVCPGGLGLANEYRRICKLRYRFINATWKRLRSSSLENIVCNAWTGKIDGTTKSNGNTTPSRTKRGAWETSSGNHVCSLIVNLCRTTVWPVAFLRRRNDFGTVMPDILLTKKNMQ